MAYLRGKYGMLYYGYYDSSLRKDVQHPAGCRDTPENRKKLKEFLVRLNVELKRKKELLKGWRTMPYTISDSFKKLEEIYSDSPDGTKKDIERFKKKFLEYFNPNSPISEVNKVNCERFLLEIKKLKQKKNSIHAYGKRLYHYINFLANEEEVIVPFKINKYIKTKPEKVPKLTFNDEDFRKIFENLYKKSRLFRTTVFCLAYMGIRTTDLLSILCENIDLEKRTISFYSPKGKKQREIGFHKDLVPILKPMIDDIKTGKLISYKKPEHLGRACTRYFEQIKIGGKKYVARTFRKTFITHCNLVFRMDKSIVKELVGHKQAGITDQYYTEFTVNSMKDELNKYGFPLLDWMNNSDPNYYNEEDKI